MGLLAPYRGPSNNMHCVDRTEARKSIESQRLICCYNTQSHMFWSLFIILFGGLSTRTNSYGAVDDEKGGQVYSAGLHGKVQ